MKTSTPSNMLRIINVWIVILLSTTAGHLRADTFKFTESLADKVICEGHGEDRFCEVAQVGAFHLTAKFGWAPGTAASIEGDTGFSLSFGNLDLSFTPSDDPKWAPGKRSVTMIFGYEDDNGRLVREGKVVLRWNDRGFSVNVSLRTGFDFSAVIAGDILEQVPGIVAGFSDYDVSFGAAGSSDTVYYGGPLRQHYSSAADDVLTSIKVRSVKLPAH
jgi:hypothetical protein